MPGGHDASCSVPSTSSESGEAIETPRRRASEPKPSDIKAVNGYHRGEHLQNNNKAGVPSRTFNSKPAEKSSTILEPKEDLPSANDSLSRQVKEVTGERRTSSVIEPSVISKGQRSSSLTSVALCSGVTNGDQRKDYVAAVTSSRRGSRRVSDIVQIFNSSPQTKDLRGKNNSMQSQTTEIRQGDGGATIPDSANGNGNSNRVTHNADGISVFEDDKDCQHHQMQQQESEQPNQYQNQEHQQLQQDNNLDKQQRFQQEEHQQQQQRQQYSLQGQQQTEEQQYQQQHQQEQKHLQEQKHHHHQQQQQEAQQKDRVQYKHHDNLPNQPQHHYQQQQQNHDNDHQEQQQQQHQQQQLHQEHQQQQQHHSESHSPNRTENGILNEESLGPGSNGQQGSLLHDRAELKRVESGGVTASKAKLPSFHEAKQIFSENNASPQCSAPRKNSAPDAREIKVHVRDLVRKMSDSSSGDSRTVSLGAADRGVAPQQRNGPIKTSLQPSHPKVETSSSTANPDLDKTKCPKWRQGIQLPGNSSPTNTTINSNINSKPSVQIHSTIDSVETSDATELSDQPCSDLCESHTTLTVTDGLPVAKAESKSQPPSTPPNVPESTTPKECGQTDATNEKPTETSDAPAESSNVLIEVSGGANPISSSAPKPSAENAEPAPPIGKETAETKEVINTASKPPKVPTDNSSKPAANQGGPAPNQKKRGSVASLISKFSLGSPSGDSLQSDKQGHLQNSEIMNTSTSSKRHHNHRHRLSLPTASLSLGTPESPSGPKVKLGRSNSLKGLSAKSNLTQADRAASEEMVCMDQDEIDGLLLKSLELRRAKQRARYENLDSELSADSTTSPTREIDLGSNCNHGSKLDLDSEATKETTWMASDECQMSQVHDPEKEAGSKNTSERQQPQAKHLYIEDASKISRKLQVSQTREDEDSTEICAPSHEVLYIAPVCFRNESREQEDASSPPNDERSQVRYDNLDTRHPGESCVSELPEYPESNRVEYLMNKYARAHASRKTTITTTVPPVAKARDSHQQHTVKSVVTARVGEDLLLMASAAPIAHTLPPPVPLPRKIKPTGNKGLVLKQAIEMPLTTREQNVTASQPPLPASTDCSVRQGETLAAEASPNAIEEPKPSTYIGNSCDATATKQTTSKGLHPEHITQSLDAVIPYAVKDTEEFQWESNTDNLDIIKTYNPGLALKKPTHIETEKGNNALKEKAFSDHPLDVPKTSEPSTNSETPPRSPSPETIDLIAPEKTTQKSVFGDDPMESSILLDASTPNKGGTLRLIRSSSTSGSQALSQVKDDHRSPVVSHAGQLVRSISADDDARSTVQNSGLSQAERIARYKEDRRRQLAYVSAKVGLELRAASGLSAKAADSTTTTGRSVGKPDEQHHQASNKVSDTSFLSQSQMEYQDGTGKISPRAMKQGTTQKSKNLILVSKDSLKKPNSSLRRLNDVEGDVSDTDKPTPMKESTDGESKDTPFQKTETACLNVDLSEQKASGIASDSKALDDSKLSRVHSLSRADKEAPKHDCVFKRLTSTAKTSPRCSKQESRAQNAFATRFNATDSHGLHSRGKVSRETNNRSPAENHACIRSSFVAAKRREQGHGASSVMGPREIYEISHGIANPSREAGSGARCTRSKTCPANSGSPRIRGPTSVDSPRRNGGSKPESPRYAFGSSLPSPRTKIAKQKSLPSKPPRKEKANPPSKDSPRNSTKTTQGTLKDSPPSHNLKPWNVNSSPISPDLTWEPLHQRSVTPATDTRRNMTEALNDSKKTRMPKTLKPSDSSTQGSPRQDKSRHLNYPLRSQNPTAGGKSPRSASMREKRVPPNAQAVSVFRRKTISGASPRQEVNADKLVQQLSPRAQSIRQKITSELSAKTSYEANRSSEGYKQRAGVDKLERERVKVDVDVGEMSFTEQHLSKTTRRSSWGFGGKINSSRDVKTEVTKTNDRINTRSFTCSTVSRYAVQLSRTVVDGGSGRPTKPAPAWRNFSGKCVKDSDKDNQKAKILEKRTSVQIPLTDTKNHRQATERRKSLPVWRNSFALRMASTSCRDSEARNDSTTKRAALSRTAVAAKPGRSSRTERLQSLKREHDETIARFKRFVHKQEEAGGTVTEISETTEEHTAHVQECYIRVGSVQEAERLAERLVENARRGTAPELCLREIGDIQDQIVSKTEGNVGVSSTVGRATAIKAESGPIVISDTSESLSKSFCQASNEEDSSGLTDSLYQPASTKNARTPLASHAQLRLNGERRQRKEDERADEQMAVSVVRKTSPRPRVCVSASDELTDATIPELGGEGVGKTTSNSLVLEGTASMQSAVECPGARLEHTDEDVKTDGSGLLNIQGGDSAVEIGGEPISKTSPAQSSNTPITPLISTDEEEQFETARISLKNDNSLANCSTGDSGSGGCLVVQVLSPRPVIPVQIMPYRDSSKGLASHTSLSTQSCEISVEEDMQASSIDEVDISHAKECTSDVHNFEESEDKSKTASSLGSQHVMGYANCDDITKCLNGDVQSLTIEKGKILPKDMETLSEKASKPSVKLTTEAQVAKYAMSNITMRSADKEFSGEQRAKVKTPLYSEDSTLTKKLSPSHSSYSKEDVNPESATISVALWTLDHLQTAVLERGEDESGLKRILMTEERVDSVVPRLGGLESVKACSSDNADVTCAMSQAEMLLETRGKPEDIIGFHSSQSNEDDTPQRTLAEVLETRKAAMISPTPSNTESVSTIEKSNSDTPETLEGNTCGKDGGRSCSLSLSQNENENKTMDLPSLAKSENKQPDSVKDLSDNKVNDHVKRNQSAVWRSSDSVDHNDIVDQSSSSRGKGCQALPPTEIDMVPNTISCVDSLGENDSCKDSYPSEQLDLSRSDISFEDVSTFWSKSLDSCSVVSLPKSTVTSHGNLHASDIDAENVSEKSGTIDDENTHSSDGKWEIVGRFFSEGTLQQSSETQLVSSETGADLDSGNLQTSKATSEVTASQSGNALAPQGLDIISAHVITPGDTAYLTRLPQTSTASPLLLYESKAVSRKPVALRSQTFIKQESDMDKQISSCAESSHTFLKRERGLSDLNNVATELCLANVDVPKPPPTVSAEQQGIEVKGSRRVKEVASRSVKEAGSQANIEDTLLANLKHTASQTVCYTSKEVGTETPNSVKLPTKTVSSESSLEFGYHSSDPYRQADVCTIKEAIHENSETLDSPTDLSTCKVTGASVTSVKPSVFHQPFEEWDASIESNTKRPSREATFIKKDVVRDAEVLRTDALHEDVKSGQPNNSSIMNSYVTKETASTEELLEEGILPESTTNININLRDCIADNQDHSRNYTVCHTNKHTSPCPESPALAHPETGLTSALEPPPDQLSNKTSTYKATPGESSPNDGPLSDQDDQTKSFHPVKTTRSQFELDQLISNMDLSSDGFDSLFLQNAQYLKDTAAIVSPTTSKTNDSTPASKRSSLASTLKRRRSAGSSLSGGGTFPRRKSMIAEVGVQRKVKVTCWGDESESSLERARESLAG